MYFNDDIIEKIYFFDPLSQRNFTKKKVVDSFLIYCSSEILLNQKNIDIFKESYSNLFDIDLKNDDFYNNILIGHKIKGLEYFLKLFFNSDLSNIFEVIDNNYSLKNTKFLIYDNTIDNFVNHYKFINEHYNRRKESGLNILPPNDIFLTDKEILFYFKKLNFVTISDLNHEKNFDFQSKRISLPFFDNIEQSKMSRILNFITNNYNLGKPLFFVLKTKKNI